ncbi:uncharacterized protein ACB058_021573 isoform 4-T4 [Synchiropus picturatus]
MGDRGTRVFKKSSPNGKLTVYLGKRDFVDHVDLVEPVEGVVLVDPEYLKERKGPGRAGLDLQEGAVCVQRAGVSSSVRSAARRHPSAGAAAAEAGPAGAALHLPDAAQPAVLRHAAAGAPGHGEGLRRGLRGEGLLRPVCRGEDPQEELGASADPEGPVRPGDGGSWAPGGDQAPLPAVGQSSAPGGLAGQGGVLPRRAHQRQGARDQPQQQDGEEDEGLGCVSWHSGFVSTFDLSGAVVSPQCVSSPTSASSARRSTSVPWRWRSRTTWSRPLPPSAESSASLPSWPATGRSAAWRWTASSSTRTPTWRPAPCCRTAPARSCWASWCPTESRSSWWWRAAGFWETWPAVTCVWSCPSLSCIPNRAKTSCSVMLRRKRPST